MIQNEQSMAELEYQTILKERLRLSREIHDGLAQTLAFLKLQTAQLQQFLARGDHEQLQEGLRLSYTALSEAYEDARQAIDGLRIEMNGKGLSGWLNQVLAEFKDASGIDVKTEQVQSRRELSPEVHAQLIRIVQEALSNVRKHTRASHIWVSYLEDDNGMILQIRDDGIGFNYEEATGQARHGLQGMRERAELIGAELQVFSEPNEGTVVRLRLPWSGQPLKGLLE